MLTDWKCSHNFIVTVLLVGTCVLFALPACSTVDTQVATPVPTNATTATVSAPPTDTPQPSPTPEPGAVILLAPPGAAPGLVGTMETVIAELAEADGLVVHTRSEMTEADWDADVRVVVVLPPDPGVGALAAAHPDTQFLAVGVPDLEAMDNLSVLGAQGERLDRQGFLAGYLAAVITPDWRVGVIGRADTPSGAAAQAGFTNGAIFY